MWHVTCLFVSAVERGECSSDELLYPNYCTSNQSESTECFEWFGNNPQKHCQTKPVENERTCMLIEPVSRSGLQQALLQTPSGLIIDHPYSAQFESAESVQAQLTNQSSSPFVAFMNFSNSDEIAKASKCFSAASLTAHFSMKHSGTKQDLKVFVHVGFEKNCTASLSFVFLFVIACFFRLFLFYFSCSVILH